MPPTFRTALQSVVERTETDGGLREFLGQIRLRRNPFDDQRSFAGFGARQGRQMGWFVLGRPREEPQIFFGGFGLEGAFCLRIMFFQNIRTMGVHMCKIRIFCTLPKMFLNEVKMQGLFRLARRPKTEAPYREAPETQGGKADALLLAAFNK